MVFFSSQDNAFKVQIWLFHNQSINSIFISESEAVKMQRLVTVHREKEKGNFSEHQEGPQHRNRSKQRWRQRGQHLRGFEFLAPVNFQRFKLDLEKAEEPEIKLPTFVGSLKKQESSRKTSTFALLTTPKPLTVWITTNCGKFLEIRIQTTWPASWEICM